MLDLLYFFGTRQTVIVLAVLGAIVTMIGSAIARGKDQGASRARLVIYTGYTITVASVLAFITAGYISGQ